MTRRWTQWGCMVAWFLGVGCVELRWSVAGPPFLTDDPEPVPTGHFEFYLAAQSTYARDGFTTTLPHFEVNYGALPDLQLHLVAPFVFDNPRDGNDRHWGYGDTELGFKYRFLHEDKWVPQAGVFPLVEVPTGNEGLGLGSGETAVFLPLWLQKSFGEWTTYGGGGYWFNPGEGNKDYPFFGWELQRKISEHLTLGGEVFFATPSQEGGENRLGVNFGGIYDFDEHWHLLFSAGRDIQGPNLLISYLALQFTF